MNELLLLGQAIVSTLFVLLAWRFAHDRLYTIITIFLILIVTVGDKVVEFFGHQTNTGNIFYASIFLASYFLIERMGKREGIISIWISVVGVAFTFIFIQGTVALVGSPETAAYNAALDATYAPLSRLTAASLVGYIISQNFNVHFYAYLKQRLRGARIWLRANLSNAIAQALDSAIFFTIAFWGVVPPANMIDIILTGFLIKIVFVAATSPLLYLNTVEREDEGDVSTIAVR
jgi:queuosine precursor transporter